MHAVAGRSTGQSVQFRALSVVCADNTPVGQFIGDLGPRPPAVARNTSVGKNLSGFGRKSSLETSQDPTVGDPFTRSARRETLQYWVPNSSRSSAHARREISATLRRKAQR
jgi:hypothetical protein